MSGVSQAPKSGAFSSAEYCRDEELGTQVRKTPRSHSSLDVNVRSLPCLFSRSCVNWDRLWGSVGCLAPPPQFLQQEVLVGRGGVRAGSPVPRKAIPAPPESMQRCFTWSHDNFLSKQAKVKSLSHVRLFATPWTVARQAPLSMGFSRQEYWSGLPFPSPGDLPNPGIEPGSPALQADALSSEPPRKPSKQANSSFEVS